MATDHPWGFALVICEDQYAAFPMTFDEPLMPQYALSEINRVIQEYCQATAIAYTHDAAVKCGTLLLVNSVLPVAEGEASDTDWLRLTTSLMFVANLTCLRYFAVHATKNDLFVKQLAGDSLSEAQDSGKAILDAIEQRTGRALTIYAIIESIGGIDSDADAT